MGVSANTWTEDADVLALEGERVSNSLCYRCGRDPDEAHDRAFCPAFGDYREAGQWLSFSDILRELRSLSEKTVSVQKSCNVEELEGAAGQWHDLVGVSVEGKYAKRLDAPSCPEFGIYDLHNGLHRQIYSGWRSVLRDLAVAAGISWRVLAKRLGVNPDRSTEEILRVQSGYS